MNLNQLPDPNAKDVVHRLLQNSAEAINSLLQKIKANQETRRIEFNLLDKEEADLGKTEAHYARVA